MNPHDEQLKLWNGLAGQAWVEAQESLDRMFRPFEELLVEAVASGTAVRRVLDVGCGTGATSLAVARLLGGKGNCTGIDISEPMLAAARDRAAKEGLDASFVQANAQTYAFEPASFDTAISRFGVMFFDDPVQAFGNLRGATREGGELRFIAWRSPAENHFMTTAQRAAAPFLPNLMPPKPDAPGQFAFADPERVRGILEQSGWAEIDVQPIDVPCTLPAGDLRRYFTRLGPLGQVLHETDEGTRTQIVDAVGKAFGPFIHGDEVRYTAACWMVRAHHRKS